MQNSRRTESREAKCVKIKMSLRIVVFIKLVFIVRISSDTLNYKVI